jgi:hypothetical protein
MIDFIEIELNLIEYIQQEKYKSYCEGRDIITQSIKSWMWKQGVRKSPGVKEYETTEDLLEDIKKLYEKI